MKTRARKKEVEIIPCPICYKECRGNIGFGKHISRMHPFTNRELVSKRPGKEE